MAGPDADAEDTVARLALSQLGRERQHVPGAR
jgi:hypothetical protein